MRIAHCNKCKRETEFETRVYNKSGYQYQGEKCKRCDEWISVVKKEIPEWFEKDMRKKIW